MRLFKRDDAIDYKATRKLSDDIVYIPCYGDTAAGQYSGNVEFGYGRIAGLSFGNSELYEHVGKDKHCAYCGNVNAPDARNCCGCQHAI